MKLTDEVMKAARTFLRGKDVGILTTVLPEGGESFPFGTMCQYNVLPEGDIVIYISDIALHTRNAKSNPHMGFAILKEDVHQQAAPRLSVVGKGRFLEQGTEEYVRVSERYFSHFPEARGYQNTHNFSFCLIRPVKVHYIQTFGRIYTFAGENLATGSTDWLASGVIEHMNQDHQSALQSYCRTFLGETPEQVELVNLDHEGFHVRYNSKVSYIPFREPVLAIEGLRKAFVGMSEYCRAQEAAPATL